jgi:hypothetical protein
MTGLPPREQTILIHLCEHSKDDGTDCKPSQKRLAARCGMHRDTLNEGLAALEKAGWALRVTVCRRLHYLLDVPRLLTLRPPSVSERPARVPEVPTHPAGNADIHLNQSGTSQDPPEVPSRSRTGSRPAPAPRPVRGRNPAPWEPQQRFGGRVPTVAGRVADRVRQLHVIEPVSPAVNAAVSTADSAGNPQQINGLRGRYGRGDQHG